MSGPERPGREQPSSVVLAAEKGRAERLGRLKTMLGKRLENPIVALDALLAEMAIGDEQKALWEELHAAAIRDGVEAAVGEAYVRSVAGARMRKLEPRAQAEVLMHAADYFQGVLGDAASAEGFLERVLSIVPGHVEAFGRLERRLEKLLDARRMLELYASVASAPPKQANVLATQAYNRVLQLSAKPPLGDDACKKLLALVPMNPRLLDALDAHCRQTKRPALACALLEESLTAEDVPEALAVQRRQKLVELYVGEAAMPASAIDHVEKLLARDPADAGAFKIAERLLSVREVSSRAAAALQTARRARGY